MLQMVYECTHLGQDQPGMCEDRVDGKRGGRELLQQQVESPSGDVIHHLIVQHAGDAAAL